jgi:sugar fermentation stimulation protein A
MRFQETLLEGRLIERYKRFMADVELETGEVVTAHCANPGAMMGLKEPGSRVFLSRASNPNRKLKYNWEFIEVGAGGGPRARLGSNTPPPPPLAATAASTSCWKKTESPPAISR